MESKNMADEPEVRACIIPNLNTRIIELALDINEQLLIICPLRESATLEKRAESLIKSTISEKVNKATVPIALRKRVMCERLAILKTDDNIIKEDIKKKKVFDISTYATTPVPIMRRKLLLYQWTLAG